MTEIPAQLPGMAEGWGFLLCKGDDMDNYDGPTPEELARLDEAIEEEERNISHPSSTIEYDGAELTFECALYLETDSVRDFNLFVANVDVPVLVESTLSKAVSAEDITKAVIFIYGGKTVAAVLDSLTKLLTEIRKWRKDDANRAANLKVFTNEQLRNEMQRLLAEQQAQSDINVDHALFFDKSEGQPEKKKKRRRSKE